MKIYNGIQCEPVCRPALHSRSSVTYILCCYCSYVSSVRRVQEARHQPPSKPPESRKSSWGSQPKIARPNLCNGTEMSRHLCLCSQVVRRHRASSSLQPTECLLLLNTDSEDGFSLARSFKAFRSIPQKRWMYFVLKDTCTKLILSLVVILFNIDVFGFFLAGTCVSWMNCCKNGDVLRIQPNDLELLI